MAVRGIRGATTITQDTPENIREAVEALVIGMAKENNVNSWDIVSVLLTATHDIQSDFPAKAVRSIEGWKYVPVMCTNEVDVIGSLPKCIRVMMHVNSEISQWHIIHVYQNGAENLRPDL